MSVVASHHAAKDDRPEELRDTIEIIQIADRVSCLLLHNPIHPDLDQEAQLAVLERSTGISCDTKTPIALSVLAQKLTKIRAESLEQIRMLGLDKASIMTLRYGDAGASRS
ncbi:MAG: hypothetical protein ACI97A_000925 [Planctomycetota bacterium]